MTERDFCCWLQGALSMATDEDGAISFSKLQADKIKENLVDALDTRTSLQQQHPFNRPDGATRC